MRSRRPPKDPLDHLPEAVTYAREQAGLTMTRLAELCGVSLSLVSEWEKGTRNATPAHLNALSEALNCPRVILESRRREPSTASTAHEDVSVRDGERAGQDSLPGVQEAAVEAAS